MGKEIDKFVDLKKNKPQGIRKRGIFHHVPEDTGDGIDGHNKEKQQKQTVFQPLPALHDQGVNNASGADDKRRQIKCDAAYPFDVQHVFAPVVPA